MAHEAKVPTGDLEFHEWCKAVLPTGWLIYGSTFGFGCSAYKPPSNTVVEFPQAILVELLRLASELREAEEAIRRLVSVTESGVVLTCIHGSDAVPDDILPAVQRALAETQRTGGPEDKT